MYRDNVTGAALAGNIHVTPHMEYNKPGWYPKTPRSVQAAVNAALTGLSESLAAGIPKSDLASAVQSAIDAGTDRLSAAVFPSRPAAVRRLGCSLTATKHGSQRRRADVSRS